MDFTFLAASTYHTTATTSAFRFLSVVCVYSSVYGCNANIRVLCVCVCIFVRVCVSLSVSIPLTDLDHLGKVASFLGCRIGVTMWLLCNKRWVSERNGRDVNNKWLEVRVLQSEYRLRSMHAMWSFRPLTALPREDTLCEHHTIPSNFWLRSRTGGTPCPRTPLYDMWAVHSCRIRRAQIYLKDNEDYTTMCL